MNETKTKKHYCGECARYHKKDCSNLIPHRVKELAGACGRFLHPFDKDKFYCSGVAIVDGHYQVCNIKERCIRYKETPVYNPIQETLLECPTMLAHPEECMDHGYPKYIRKS